MEIFMAIWDTGIKRAIKSNLRGGNLQNALDFVAYLKAQGMSFVRGKGYWADKLYFLVKHKNEFVCFILIGAEYPGEAPDRWMLWANDSASYADFPLEGHLKEIAWANVDVCGSCGYCAGGTRRPIFGKEFEKVCLAPMCFTNPDEKTLAFMKKIVDIRKNDITAPRPSTEGNTL
ncbi:MAG: hypothetical protein FWE98_05280 [Oscillospiraceae bacterium]|nr:hypothetical protein [Oscillospiraceae bacterium]